MNDKYAPRIRNAGARKRQSPLCKHKFTTSPITVTTMRIVMPLVSQSGPRKADQPASPFRTAHTTPKMIARFLKIASSPNAKVSDASQPPMTLNSSLSETAGSR
jgi:hypothetical protein